MYTLLSARGSVSNGTPPKTSSTSAKHAVSFEEATSVFYDDQALLIQDDEVIRIVNARRANRSERAQYELRGTR